MKIDLHLHTYHSLDSNIGIAGLIRTLKKRGLDGAAITDHDTLKGVEEAREAFKKSGLILIPGIEVTTRFGHISGLFINEPIEKGIDTREAIDVIHSQGGLAIAVHPFDLFRTSVSLGGRVFKYKFDAIEVFNSLTVLGLGNKAAEKASKKMRIPGVVGSDAHFLEDIGRACIITKRDDLYKSIKDGDFSISKAPSSVFAYLKSAAVRINNL